MADLTLVIGNKNYSSWSLRPWLALKMANATFREELIRLNLPDTKAKILAHSPAGQVPILKDGDLVVWESLAICEYVAERFPAARLWPDDIKARAVARSMSTEMHGGFAPMRKELPMDIRARKPLPVLSAEAKANVERVCAIWREARQRFGGGGAMLFGRFSVADCMYAPVVTRFATYGVPLDPVCASYRDAILALPPMKEWTAAAKDEPWSMAA
jgi:glutathione S-transferase